MNKLDYEFTQPIKELLFTLTDPLRGGVRARARHRLGHHRRQERQDALRTGRDTIQQNELCLKMASDFESYREGDNSGCRKPPVDLDLGCSALLPGQ